MAYSNIKLFQRIIVLVCIYLLTAYQTTSAQTTTPVDVGNQNAKSPATGSAGGAIAFNKSNKLGHCERPLGTVSLLSNSPVINTRYHNHHTPTDGDNSTSTTPSDLLRLFVQQSNCFVVVERNFQPNSIQYERRHESNHELVEANNLGKGQLVAADYIMVHHLIFNNDQVRGRWRDKDGGWYPVGLAGILTDLYLGIDITSKEQDAQVLLRVIDNRTHSQILIAQGSALGVDQNASIGVHHLPYVGFFLEKHASTIEEKIIVGAYLDAFNNIILASKNYEPQQSVDDYDYRKGESFSVTD